MVASPTLLKSVFEMETKKSAIETTVRCSGRLVSDTCDKFQTAVRELIPTTKLLVLDMTGVNYIDSSALGAIIGLYLSSKRAGCQLKLTNLAPRVKELLSMTRLQEVLESHAKEEMFGHTPS